MQCLIGSFRIRSEFAVKEGSGTRSLAFKQRRVALCTNTRSHQLRRRGAPPLTQFHHGKGGLVQLRWYEAAARSVLPVEA